MGIITAILSVVGTVISTVVSVVCGIVKVLPWWTWLVPLGIIIGVYIATGDVKCSCRDLGCGCRRRDPRPPRPPVSRSYTVVQVISGVEFEVAGRNGRHTARVTLADIDASRWPEESRQHLEQLAGSTIRVESPRRGLFRSTPNDIAHASQQGSAAVDEEALLDELEGGAAHAAPEARSPIMGIVYGQFGAPLNISQVADGYAVCNPSAPAEWKAMEAKARKSKSGMWSKTKE